MGSGNAQNTVLQADTDILLVKARKISRQREVIAMINNIGLHKILLHQAVHSVPLMTKHLVISVRELSVVAVNTLLRLNLFLVRSDQ